MKSHVNQVLTPARLVAALLVLMAAPFIQAAEPPGDVVQGKSLYEAKCGGCHSLDENRIGPKHRGVVGRRVASISDYDYSPALKKAGGTWTPERLDMWLQGPQDLIPGAKMFFSVMDPNQRSDIVAYLQTTSGAVAAK